MRYVDFNDILPNVHPVCTNAGYAADERDVLTPALIEAGCTTLSGWYDGERDSFGPLSRCITVEKDGEEIAVVYG